MSDAGGNSDLLDRATAALERIDATMARQAKSFDRQAKSFDRIDATMARQAESFDRQAESFDRLAERIEADRVASHAHFERMMRRIDRSEAIFVEAIGDIDLSIKRSNDRLEDMGGAIRANTQAVLSVLDRLGPATG